MAGRDDRTLAWLEEARGGSRDALGRLLEEYRAYLLRVAIDEIDPRLRAKSGASDIVQQTFLEAQRDIERFEGDSEEAFLAWLRMKLRFNVTKFGRSYRDTEKRRIGLEIPIDIDASAPGVSDGLVSPGPSPSEVAMVGERDHEIERVLAGLPEDYRCVIELRYWRGLPFDEIATVLDRSPNAVRKLWARAVLQLKDGLRGI